MVRGSSSEKRLLLPSDEDETGSTSGSGFSDLPFPSSPNVSLTPLHPSVVVDEPSIPSSSGGSRETLVVSQISRSLLPSSVQLTSSSNDLMLMTTQVHDSAFSGTNSFTVDLSSEPSLTAPLDFTATLMTSVAGQDLSTTPNSLSSLSSFTHSQMSSTESYTIEVTRLPTSSFNQTTKIIATRSISSHVLSSATPAITITTINLDTSTHFPPLQPSTTFEIVQFSATSNLDTSSFSTPSTLQPSASSDGQTTSEFSPAAPSLDTSSTVFSLVVTSSETLPPEEEPTNSMSALQYTDVTSLIPHYTTTTTTTTLLSISEQTLQGTSLPTLPTSRPKPSVTPLSPTSPPPPSPPSTNNFYTSTLFLAAVGGAGFLFLTLLLVFTCILVACRKKIKRKCSCCKPSHKVEGPIISISYQSSYHRERESYFINNNQLGPRSLYSRSGEDDASTEFMTTFFVSPRTPRLVGGAVGRDPHKKDEATSNVKFKTLERSWRPSTRDKVVSLSHIILTS